MNIAIDVTPVENKHAQRGSGVYVSNLIEALKQYEPKHSYSYFTHKQKVPGNADLVHYPYFDPFFLTLPLSKPKPTVVTVHDLIPLVFPDKFPPGIRGNIKWQIQRLSLKSARRVITDSKSSKKDIAHITHINPGNIDVVYLAPNIKPATTKNSGYPEHFILYVGDVNWNKNVPGLLGAFELFLRTVFPKGQSFPQEKLVLVGKAFLDSTLTETQEINMLVSSLGLEKQVIRVGFVEDLAPLYSFADCLVMPSHYEGFGLPVLEAMACGCPVVVADNSSLSEIAGPALRVSTDPKSIAAGIQTATENRKKLVGEGLEWARRFTWKKAAEGTVKAYEKVLAAL